MTQIERCFQKGEIETLAFRPIATALRGGGIAVSPSAAWVKVVHRPSGLTAVGKKYPSQPRNKAIALLGLLRKLEEASR